MTYWNLSTTFAGFTEVQASNQTVTLSDSADTVVSIEIDGPSTPSALSLAPQVLAINGGFRVCDPSSGAVTDVGALIAESTTDPSNPASWYITLVFPPQPSSIEVLIKSWGTFAVFTSGTN